MGAPSTRNAFSALDLVTYNGSKHGGLVLQVHEDYLKVLNEQSKIDNVKVIDIGKKIPPPRRGGNIQGHDRKGNSLVHDCMVKCIDGPYKNLIAPIKHAFKNYLFLWHKDFVQQNGIFVENCRNVIILGDEFMKQSSSSAISNQNRMVKDDLVGEEVVIIGGQYKGHRGRVCFADDKQAIVELSSQCKKIPIKKHLVSKLKNPEEAYGRKENVEFGGRSNYGGASAYGGATVYDGGKTPGAMHTPSYHPQSAWGPNEFDKEEANFQRPGSQHYQDHMQEPNYGGPTPGRYDMKNEN